MQRNSRPIEANSTVGTFESNVLIDRIKALESENEKLKKEITVQSKKMQDLIMEGPSFDTKLGAGRSAVNARQGPLIIFERAKTVEVKEEKKEIIKPEDPKPEEPKPEAPPSDPTGRGAPRGPPARGPPGRGPPTGPPGRGPPAGPPAPGGRGAPGGPPPPPGRGAAVPLAPPGRGRGGPAGPAGRGMPGRAVGRGPAAKPEIQPTKKPIKVSQKMKPFFWKRVLLAPDTPNTVIWKRIKEEPVDQ